MPEVLETSTEIEAPTARRNQTQTFISRKRDKPEAFAAGLLGVRGVAVDNTLGLGRQAGQELGQGVKGKGKV